MEPAIRQLDRRRFMGLFAGLGGIKLRRQFAERWELESTLGVESGVDLFYIFNFE